VTDSWSAKTIIGPLCIQAGCHRRPLNLALVFLYLFCVAVHFFWLVNVCFCCVRFSFSIPSQEIGLRNVSKLVSWSLTSLFSTNMAISETRTSPKWPILCRVGCKTLTQSILIITLAIMNIVILHTFWRIIVLYWGSSVVRHNVMEYWEKNTQ